MNDFLKFLAWCLAFPFILLLAMMVLVITSAVILTLA